MIIFSDNFRKYDRILSLAYQKGGREEESLYLDFKNSYAYFRTLQFVIRLKFNFELDSNEELPENFWVNAPDFTTLLKYYPQLLLKQKVFYNPNDEREIVKIDTFMEDFDDEYFNQDKDSWEVYSISDETLQYLREAYLFTSNDILSDYIGVYLNNHKLLSTDRNKFYCVDIKENFTNFYLHSDLIKVILPTGFSYNNVTLYRKNNKTILVINNNDISVYSSEILNFEVPDINDKDFVRNYNHQTHIIFKRDDFLEILRFMDFFIKDLVNKRIAIAVKEDRVSIESIEEKTIIKILPTTYFSPELKNQHIYLSLPYIQLALNTLDDKILKLQLDPERVATTFTSMEKNNKNNKLVIVARLEE